MVSLTKSSDADESKLETTPISELTPDSKSVSILFKIISMSPSRQVKSSRTGRRLLVQDAVAGDSTAVICMTLWNEDADSLQEGHSYLLTKGYVREYDECMYLLRSQNGKFREIYKHIEQVNEGNDMSRPFAGRKPQRRTPRTKSGRSFRGTPGREEKGYCSWKGF